MSCNQAVVTILSFLRPIFQHQFSSSISLNKFRRRDLNSFTKTHLITIYLLYLQSWDETTRTAVSFLQLTPTVADNGGTLQCLASNPVMESEPGSKADVIRLNVTCKLYIIFSFRNSSSSVYDTDKSAVSYEINDSRLNILVLLRCFIAFSSLTSL